MILLSQTIWYKQIWSVVALSGRMLIIPLIVIFAISYTQLIKKMPKYFYLILWTPFVLAILLAISNDWHHLIWFDLTQDPQIFSWRYGRGIYLNLLILISYILLAFTFFIMVGTVNRLNGIYRKQAINYFSMIFLPVSLNILHVFVGDLPRGLNFASIGFLLSGIILIISASKFPALNLEPIYTRHLIDNLSNGVVAVDHDGYVIELNKTASTFAECEAPWIGKLVGEVFPFLTEVLQDHSPEETIRKDLKIKLNPSLVIDLSVSPLKDALDRNRGRLVVWCDMTALYQSKERLFERECQLGVIRERERIHQEMHDNIGQAINYLRFSLNRLRYSIDEQNTASALAQIDALDLVAKQASSDMKAIFVDESEFGKEEIDFSESLSNFLNRFEIISGIKVNLILPKKSLDELLDLHVRVHLLRIIQEAITNVYKHADAERIEIVIFELSETIQVIVEDDGVGFSQPNVQGKGFVLGSIKKRALESGGELTIQSEPNQGTHISIILPKKKNIPYSRTLENMNIVLIDDHALVLEGLKSMLEERGTNVVGTAQRVEDGLRLCHQLSPNLVLLDIYMPGGNGLEYIKQFKQLDPEMKVILLSMSSAENDLYAAKQAGADGYLLKTQLSEDFFDELTSIVEGRLEFGSNIVPFMLDALPVSENNRNEAVERLITEGLSTVQIKVLELVAKSQIYKEIALKTALSESAVKYHVERILKILDFQNRNQAVSYAYEIGLVSDRRKRQ